MILFIELFANVLYILLMNIKRRVQFLTNTMDTIVMGWKYPNYLWQWCLTRSKLLDMGAEEAQYSRHMANPPRASWVHSPQF